MLYLRQSTASQEVPLGYFVDSTDGNTEETALTIANTDIKIWKTGATTLANKNSGGATHISNGVYYAVLDATDTDTLGPLVVFVHVTGALAVRLECCVLDEPVYDAMVANTDNWDVNVVQWLGTAAATPTVAGVPEVDLTHVAGAAVSAASAQLGVNVVQLSGDATAADNAEAFFDGTGYAGTGNVIPTVTSVTAIAAGGITAGSIATDAIGAAELAADAVAEIAAAVAAPTAATIADAVWDEDATAHQTTGTFGQAIGDPGADTNTIYKAVVTDATGATVGVDVAAVLDDTGTAGVVVASLATGSITASVIAANAIGASELAADAVTEIAGAVWDEATATHTTAGTFGEQVKTDIDAILADTGTDGVVVNAAGFATDAVTEIVTAVWAKTMTELTAVPAAAADVLTALTWLFELGRNKLTQTATTTTIFKDDGSTTLSTSTVSDDGATFTRGEWA